MAALLPALSLRIPCRFMGEEVLQLVAPGDYWLLLEAEFDQSFADVVGVGEGGESIERRAFGWDERNAEAVEVGTGIECSLEERRSWALPSQCFKVSLAHLRVVVGRKVLLVPGRRLLGPTLLHLFVSFHNNTNNKCRRGGRQGRKGQGGKGSRAGERGGVGIQSWIIKCQYLTIEMSGQQLPKATMASFVRKHSDLHSSPEFIARLLELSKEFIVRLSDKSNDICELHNKKTISAEHLEAALQEFGLTTHLENLKQLENDIKEMNGLKREASKRLEESIERGRQEERERRLKEEPEKKEVTVRETFDQLELKEQEEEDYEKMEPEEEPVKGVGSASENEPGPQQ